ncbi:hypothetical protein KSP39_PZI008246 [Platanthera zijinensis]|uniref:Retrotransposon gag domain-containing protein n=1 Tax=Platanthera zijinensis TaxID=2320716 RepID=A0AAP0BM71_9ASPA
MWEKAMLNALCAKNKLDFINGTLVQPTPSSPEAAYWDSCNSILISWIFNSLDKSIQHSVAYMDTTKAVWDDLKARFSLGNALCINELRSQLASLHQQGSSVMHYYTKLKGMWDELHSYSTVPSYTCGAVQAFVKEHEEEKLHQFLMGLDDATFGTKRSQILSMDPLPTKAYTIVTCEERHHTIARGQDDRLENITLATHATSRPWTDTP